LGACLISTVTILIHKYTDFIPTAMEAYGAVSCGQAPLSAARKGVVDITNNPEQNLELVPFEDL